MATSPYSKIELVKSESSAVNAILQVLNDRWHLGLPIRDHTYFSSKQGDTLADKCRNLIESLYFARNGKQGDSVYHLVDKFNEVAERYTEDERLQKLSDMLEEMKYRTPIKRKAIHHLSSASRPIFLETHEQDEDSPSIRSSRDPVRLANTTRSISTNHVGSSQFDSWHSASASSSNQANLTGSTPSLHLSSNLLSKMSQRPQSDHIRRPVSRAIVDMGSSSKAKIHLPQYNLPFQYSSESFTTSASSSPANEIKIEPLEYTRAEAFTTPTSAGSSFISRSTDTTGSFLSTNEPSASVTPATSFGSGSGSVLTRSNRHSYSERFGEISSPSKRAKYHASQRACLEHYLVAELPQRGFYQDDLPKTTGPTSFRAKHECIRIAIENSAPSGTIATLIPPELDSAVDIHRVVKSHGYSIPKVGTSVPEWLAAATTVPAVQGSRRIILRGSLTFGKTRQKGVFNLKLEPLRLENSCRFERKYEWHRYLYLDVPCLDKGVPHPWTDQKDHLLKRFLEWLLTKHTLFGRKWRAIELKQKSTKKQVRSDQHRQYSYAVTLFAVEGVGIPKVSLREAIEWFLPLANNLDRPSCKMASRLALGFSRTEPTFEFLPSQVRYLDKDIFATDDPDEAEFNDQFFDWTFPYREDRVMNDGCSRISLGAAKMVWANHPASRGCTLPSVFQARIGPAKGIWSISASPDSACAEDHDIWIEITPSQVKFDPHLEDRNQDGKHDPVRLTFEVCEYSRPLRPSNLHKAFLPILVDRKVPQEIILDYVRNSLSQGRETLLDMVKVPSDTKRWVKNTYRSFLDKTNEVSWLGGEPDSLAENAIFLLKAGFEPTKLPYLADKIRDMVYNYFSRMLATLKLPCSRSTFAFGIADPTGSLRPGQIHLCFSEAFKHPEGGYISLDGFEVLVTRHPTLRASDIQKHRGVYHHKLRHIHDVVVFPSVGPFPLADKLQGGDYDGDRYFLCWEPDLVRSFRNAPAPTEKPKPENYGIQVDKETLRSKLCEGSASGPITDIGLRQWLAHSFEFQCKQSQLGAVTNLYDRLVYWENRIDSKKANALADMHDLLVDAPKQGYIYDQESFQSFVKDTLGIQRQQLQHYEDHINTYFGPESSTQKRHSMLRRGSGRATTTRPMNRILDRLYFEVVLPHIQATLTELEGILYKNSTTLDLSLSVVVTERHRTGDKVMRNELLHLSRELDEVYKEWCKGWCKNKPLDKNEQRNVIVNCFKRYSDIQPRNMSHLGIREWVAAAVPNEPPYWERLKASAIWKKFHEQPEGAWENHKGRFVFAMAAEELVFIKAYSFGRRVWHTTDGMRRSLELRPFRRDVTTTAATATIAESAQTVVVLEENNSDEDWDELLKEVMV